MVSKCYSIIGKNIYIFFSHCFQSSARCASENITLDSDCCSDAIVLFSVNKQRWHRERSLLQCCANPCVKRATAYSGSAVSKGQLRQLDKVEAANNEGAGLRKGSNKTKPELLKHLVIEVINRPLHRESQQVCDLTVMTQLQPGYILLLLKL